MPPPTTRTIVAVLTLVFSLVSAYLIPYIKTKGDTDLDDYDYGEDEEPAGEEDLDEDAEEEMDDEFTMDAEPEDEKL